MNAKIVDSILRRSTRAAPILVAYFLLVPGLARSDSSANPPGSAQIDYGMPERLGRQVSPTPSVPWSAPDLRGYTSLLKSAEPSPIDQQKRYSLVELIDIAERVNPETRVAWEAARQAAIGVGLVESEYFPVLTLSALGGYQSEAFPAPKDVAPSGFFRANLNQILPTLNLRWLLLDFGRRGNAWDAAKERLLAANLGFNRKHQEIIFNVQRAFLGLTSLRGKIAVAQSAVDSARAVRESAEAQLRNGLATIPEVSLARQQEAQAAFDLEDVLATERDAQVALAESIGIPPTTPIQVTDFSALPPPAALEDSADKVIDQTLERRPDLIAKVAALRGKEAEVRRARAAYFPTLSLVSNVNTLAGRVKVTGGNQPTGWFSAAEPSYGAGLAFRVEPLRGRRHPEKSGTRRGRAPGRRRRGNRRPRPGHSGRVEGIHGRPARGTQARCRRGVGGCLAEVLRDRLWSRIVEGLRHSRIFSRRAAS